MNGRPLHFRLAGINNQNFLMRDDETGSWWQQITGKAIFGPLKGQHLDPVLSDELTFGLWKQESAAGQVLAPGAKYQSEYESDWEPKVAKLPVVINFPGTALQSRDVLIGMEIGGASRAYPMSAVLAQTPVQDRLGGTPILLVVGPDGKSVRAFVSRLDGQDIEVFRESGTNWALVDLLSVANGIFKAVRQPAQPKENACRHCPPSKITGLIGGITTPRPAYTVTDRGPGLRAP